MTQETRRLLAARRAMRRLGDRLTGESILPGPLRVGRFSRGLERRPETLGKLKVGRFSRGLERTAEEAPEKEHVGRFSEGREQLPEDAAGKRGIGRFSRGLDHEDAEPPDDPRPPLG